MEKAAQIRAMLKKMASEVGPNGTLLATVKSVDEAEQTCVLFDDDLEIDFYDVRLRPVLDGNTGLTLVPKVGAWALAIRVEDGDDWMLITASEFDKVLLNCEQVVINGGTKGGIVNWLEVKAELDKTNALVNALKQSLTGWAPVPNDGGAALKVYAATQIGVLTTGDFNDKVDDKVKH
jgi:hypothetical protein